MKSVGISMTRLAAVAALLAFFAWAIDNLISKRLQNTIASMNSIERSINEFDQSQSIIREIGGIKIALQGILWNLGEKGLIEKDLFKLKVADVLKAQTANEMYVSMVENNYNIALKLQDAAIEMPTSSGTRKKILQIIDEFGKHVKTIEDARHEYSKDIKTISSYDISPFSENPPQEMVESMHRFVGKFSNAIREPSIGIESYIYELISLRFEALSELRQEKNFYESISRLASYVSLSFLAMSSILVIFTKFKEPNGESEAKAA